MILFRAGPAPGAQQKAERAVVVDIEVAIADGETDRRTDEDESDLDVKGEGAGAFANAELTRHHDHGGVAQRGHDRQQADDLEQIAPGPQHDDRPDHAYNDNRPATQSYLFAEHRLREDADKKRCGIKQHHGICQRHRRERDKEKHIRKHQHRTAQ